MPEEEFVKFSYGLQWFRVRKSDVEDKRNKVIILPNGTALDLNQMFIDTTDKHGNKLACPRLVGTNSDYDIWGQLPVIGTIKAEKTRE